MQAGAAERIPDSSDRVDDSARDEDDDAIAPRDSAEVRKHDQGRRPGDQQCDERHQPARYVQPDEHEETREEDRAPDAGSRKDTRRAAESHERDGRPGPAEKDKDRDVIGAAEAE